MRLNSQPYKIVNYYLCLFCTTVGTQMTCPDPGTPPGARRMFGAHAKVTYSCNNRILVGSKERMCMTNGQWTGREPTCYCETNAHYIPSNIKESHSLIETHTKTLYVIFAHLFWHFAFQRHVNMVCFCLEDTRDGRQIRILKNSTLNIYIAMEVSESIDEQYVTNTKQAVRLLIRKISSFSVNPNYDILFYSSVIHKTVDILDGTIDLKTMLDPHCVFCTFLFLESTNGTDLALVFRHFLEQMTHIKSKVGDKTFEEHHHVFIVFTDGGFNKGGDPAPTVAKIKNMVYLSDTPGQQDPSREEHLDIYIFGIGANINHEALMPLTVGRRGRHFFKMQDHNKLKEAFVQMIDESEETSLCGLHRSYVTYDKESSRRVNPWYAYVIVQVKKITFCFGSLVTSNFILTAAHCFRIQDRPEHVTVEINDGKNTVKNFFVHEKFDPGARKEQGVLVFYDYDVALIQLEGHVVIADTVRPICIPCTTETRDALRLDKNSTCKQQEELLLGDDTVHLSFLTRASVNDDTVNEVLVKDVQAKLGNNRPECIKHALEAPNINTDNVTIPVTENFLCTGGQYPTVDHIACTGDSGGAMFKDYDYRTVQVGVVSWGTKELCQSGGLVNSDASSRDFHINLFKVVPFLKRILGNDNQDDFPPLVFLN
uniref:C3/C5 convertase n=1 Tax=Gouania willdenowi TaxID=441366 RepID=A0A8C5GYI5_GOUWI